MNSKEMIGKIECGEYNSIFSKLYSNIEIAKSRYIKAVNGFVNEFGDRDDFEIFSAPGRTEVSGNHTDHQHGSIIGASVDKDIIAIVSKNKSNKITIKSEGFPADSISINELEIKNNEKGKSVSLIRGVIAGFKKENCSVCGFDAYTTSNVLKGSGLSSSAAFEVLIATILNLGFNSKKLSEINIAKICQAAECDYFGKPCGLLDQTASAVGGFVFADFHDPKNPVTANYNFDIEKFGYTLCVVDTGGSHANLTQDYADITLEMKEISNALGCDFLRDADEDKFYSMMGELRRKFGERAVLRTCHFFAEQKRVYSMPDAIKSNDIEKFLKFVNESGDSSLINLQNLFSVSCPKSQGITLGISLTKSFNNGDGAVRVHGGGFAGTIQAYIKTERINEYKKYIENIFGEGSCHVLKIRPVGGIKIQ